MPPKSPSSKRAVELFAGVGGFRLALEKNGWSTILSNQWEPGARRQFASDCYIRRFGTSGHTCEDIATVLDKMEAGESAVPEYDLVVGGFPCQDYSVAKPLNQAHGIEGKKGVLWWEIYRFLRLSTPRFALLENVDRMLNSPGAQRGRDFAIILACLLDLGYRAEWRVINAADYGFPQRRRRVFIYAERSDVAKNWSGVTRLFSDGVLARAFPVRHQDAFLFDGVEGDFKLSEDAHEVSKSFGRNGAPSPFRNGGLMAEGTVWTRDVEPEEAAFRSDGPHTLGDIVRETVSVDGAFYVAQEQLPKWIYLKGAKNERRVHKASGGEYFYTEGALPFPDPLDRPARTVLTAEGGAAPSRFKHIIMESTGKYRRLVPEELEALNGFPRGWTNTGMSDIQRAFCMGNALVVGVVEQMVRFIGSDATSRSRAAIAVGAEGD